MCKVAHSGEEEIEDVDLALLFRRFPKVNDLTLGYASRPTRETYKALAEVCVCVRERVKSRVAIFFCNLVT